jgi:hypothetical protein
VLAIALVAVLVAVAFFPSVQTWVAQMALDRRPDLQGSLGSLAAGFGKVEVTDLRLTVNGAVFTVPDLVARLPLTTAVWDRSLPVRTLVAKGWTLDLTRAPGPAGAAGPAGSAAGVTGEPGAPAPAKAVSAQDAARLFLGMLSRWALPCDLSLDGVDLEGDVLLAASAGGAPTRVHVIVKGGGMAAGHEGAFAIDATSETLDSEMAVTTLAGHGHLVVAMKTPRTFSRIEVKADLSVQGGPFPNGLALSADVATALGADEETYALEVSRGDRHLATVFVRFPEAATRLAGTWKVDFQDSDVALFAPGRPLPRFTAVGNGQFDVDVAFTTVHALGRLSAALSQLDVVAPFLERLGAATLDTGFDVVQTGKSLRVDRLSVSLTGAGPTAAVQALQPFEVDEAAGNLKPVNPADDWMNLSIRGFPLDWLSGFTDGFALSGGGAAGEFVVRAENGGFALRSKAPLTATGVAVERAGRTVGRRLDLSLSLLADYGPKGWQIQAAPLKVSSGGCPLAELDVKASRPAGPDQPIAIGGTWNADLQAPALKEAVPDLSWVGGRSASGDFSATVGTSTELDGKLAVVGRDERRSITASIHAAVDEGGRISFLAPVKVAFGPSVSDVSVEGTLIRDEAKTFIYVKLNGKEVVLEHLRLLTGAVAAAEGWPLAAAAGAGTPSRGRDRIPFWGDWAGRVAVAFDRVKAGEMTLEDVGGSVQVDHHSVHLEAGRGALAGHRIANMEGSLSFDAAAEFPYSLKATASLEPVEAATYFPASNPEGSPLIEGRFSVAGTLVGNGINLEDLVNRTQEEVRLASTAGIVRVFKTDVDEALPPDTESSAADAMGRIGSAVGSFFGVEGAGWGRKSVSPVIQAAIDVINATSEIGFDQFTVTAVRGADHTIRLVDLAMIAGDERVTGSGQITYVQGLPLHARPLRVDLQFGARGQIAKLFSAAGLLSTRKDDLGYTLLSQPIVFGGTLEHIDNRQWHELLVKAATPRPAGAKKGG